MIGQIVGNYKILEALGEGGVGMVYKGVDTMLDREVAIKVLRPELASQTSVVERFRSEAVTLAKLSHPNIATLFSLFRHASNLIMVMEFVRGESLETLIQRRGRLSSEETIPIFCQALDGINHAHEVGIIHRDIKPSNMILTETGTLKVLDFGIARLLGSSRMTRVGNIIGTLEYMSPEQVRGEDTDARSDIYALGMMLYEILTGKMPFESENEFVLMKMQTEEMPAPPRQLNPDIPEEIEAAIMRAVAKDPNERFQDAGGFLQTLLAVDLPLSAANQFGMAAFYQAKARTRPSNPGLRQTDPFSREPAKTSPADKSPQTPAIAALPGSITKEFVPETPAPAALLRDTAEIESAPPTFKETRIAQAEVAPEPTVALKETRLGAGDQPFEQSGIKSTRLGVPQTVESNYANAKPASIFDRLTWIHYAGAGAAAVILLSIIGLAAVGPMLFSSEPEKPVANQPVVKEAPKPASNTAPSSNESTQRFSAPPAASDDPPSYQPINSAQPPAPPEEARKDPKAPNPTDNKKSPPKAGAPSDKRAPPSGTRPEPPKTRKTPSLTDN